MDRQDNPNSANEAPTWTPARNPWRQLRRAAVVGTLLGLAAWGAWALAQGFATMSLAALKKPAVAEADQKVGTKPAAAREEKPAVRRERAVEVKAVSTPSKGGPVVRDVTD